MIPPEDLRHRLESVHGSKEKFQTYLWVTTDDQCFETRGLPQKDRLQVARGQYKAHPAICRSGLTTGRRCSASMSENNALA